MDLFVARQAIFNYRLEVIGYELLFRPSALLSIPPADDTLASSQVISSTFFSIGVEKILGGKRGFINFPRDMLVDERFSVLPPHLAVVEILETVRPEMEVILACRRLKDQGYLLALDDFTDNGVPNPLAEIADFLKVDFRATPIPEQERLSSHYGARGLKMLAEKVETREEFERARKMGYAYFQGFFFARPVVFASREIPGFKLNYLRILREIHNPELEFDEMEKLIVHEMSLCYKLLRYVNSAAFPAQRRIHSVRQALVLLGEIEIRKWVSLVALLELAVDKPEELVLCAILRGRFCEAIAAWVGLESRASDLFMMGMFSLLDAIMDRPLEELLNELQLPEDVQQALLSDGACRNRLAEVYSLVRAYEAAEWERLAEVADSLQVPKDQIPQLYLDCVDWSEQVFRG